MVRTSLVMLAAILGVTLVGCAKATDGPPGGSIDGSVRGDGGGGGGGGDGGGGGGSDRSCPAGQLATNVDASGNVTCSDVDPKPTVVESCSVFYGWRDDCNGCADPPVKWGRSSTAGCENGSGADNRCTTPTLAGSQVQLFGLNPDGDVDGNDKLYSGFHCKAVESSVDSAPCPAGHFVTGMYGSSWTCAPAATVVAEYMRTRCSLYTGWQDNCNGCTTAPAKWGKTSTTACENGAGADNTCVSAMLGGETVNLFGLNPDGDLDGNDKLHVALHCEAAEPATSTSMTGCPAGQFVTGTLAEGGFRCESIAPVVAAYVRERCSVFYGWRDNCEACADAPAKWGFAKVGACDNVTGADNTCTKFTLGGASLDMFGLSPDGDVDGNDTLYLGLRCD